MESTTSRSNTAAILAAVGKLGHGQDGHVKKDDAKTDSEMKKEPDSPAAVKMEASAETASLNRKRTLDSRCSEELAWRQDVLGGRHVAGDCYALLAES